MGSSMLEGKPGVRVHPRDASIGTRRRAPRSRQIERATEQLWAAMLAVGLFGNCITNQSLVIAGFSPYFMMSDSIDSAAVKNDLPLRNPPIAITTVSEYRTESEP